MMSEQLRVRYQQLLFKITTATKLVCSLWCHFILRKLHYYQCIPANSLTSGANYMPADTKLCDNILLVFIQQEINIEKNLKESKISSHQFKI